MSCNTLLLIIFFFAVAQKTGFVQFNSYVVPFMILYTLCIIISIFIGKIIFIIPLFVTLIFGTMLRFHIVRTYNITSNGDFIECLSAFCCCMCSVAQSTLDVPLCFALLLNITVLAVTSLVARHVYGYTKVFDGDADPLRPDEYSRPMQV